VSWFASTSSAEFELIIFFATILEERVVGLNQMELTCLARSALGNSSLLRRTSKNFLAPKPSPKTVVRTGAWRAPCAIQQTAKEADSKRARLPENVDGEFYVGMSFGS